MRVYIDGEEVLVDAEEAWRFAPGARNKYFVLHSDGPKHLIKSIKEDAENGGRHRVYYHSEIHDKPEGNVIYHKDLNTLNCMKSNLADCTRKDLAKILARIRKGEQA